MQTRITEAEMLSRLHEGEALLTPLVISHIATQPRDMKGVADARVKAGLPGSEQTFVFRLESKSRSTPQAFQLAVAIARQAVQEGEHPMIQVPYLSPERIAELEKLQISGIDLCGNGAIVVPGQLWISRSGHPNLYRDSRPLNNPYRGKSAMVARAVLERRTWPGLNALAHWIQSQGIDLSLGQTSKAVHALEEDILVAREDRAIVLRDPQQLLDKLGRGWSKPEIRRRGYFRLPQGKNELQPLTQAGGLRWVVMGESSAARYVTFTQGGPRRVAVTDIDAAIRVLNGVPESVPSFADVEFHETHEPGYYFAHEADEVGIRWASALQTWLELQAGDARQQEGARDLRRQLLGRIQE